MIKGSDRLSYRFVRRTLTALLFTILGAMSSTVLAAEKAKQPQAPVIAAPAPLTFSATPSDAEFLHAGLFAEPLAPIVQGDSEDNKDLAKALLSYKSEVEQSGAPDAITPILRYLDSHPDSPWRASLQLNLGMIYRQTGHFSKALAIWQDGWEQSKGATDSHGKAIANAIVARLSQLEAYLGRKELLSPLLDSLKDRPIGGTAAQLLTNSREGFYEMTYKPEDSFRCGPLALKRILNHGSQATALALKVLDHESPSTDHGLSLSNVKDIAERAGMHYQAAFRSPGAPVIFPAVAHWNVGHYAALVDKQKDGRYVVQDTTFGEDIRISQGTLDEESSGYFLIPKGPLPKGWRSVSDEEGNKIWGRGNTGGNFDPGGTGPGQDPEWDPGAPPAPGLPPGDGCVFSGCTSASVELSVVGLQLHDTPVGYHPPLGPDVRFSLYYSHRDTQQPATFNYTNFGPKWTFTWLSYITDSVSSSSSALLYRRGGGNEPFTFAGTTSTTSYPGPYSQTTLTRTVNGGGNSTSFTLTHPDGSSQVYGLASGSQFFMTAMKDPAGNTVSLTYDGSMRITSITDAIGQVTTLTYGSSLSNLLVTKITDPFGRSASFTYNSSGLLASITDVLGITSSYTYGQGSDTDFINTLTTPYGSSNFVYGDLTTNPALGNTRFLKTTDPLGRVSYVEFDQGVDAGDSSGGVLTNSSLLPSSAVNTCNQYLNYRNTFVFDANQYQLATANGGLNYSLAKVIHWLHTSDGSTTSRVKESEKQPLENRVWYNYPAQAPNSGCGGAILFTVSNTGTVTNGASSQPTVIGRVLDNGSTQTYQYQYNAQGNITQYTDPVGREWAYTYAANGIDRLTTTNITGGRSDLLETRTYDAQHLPLTIKGANGKTAHYAYNSDGQPTKYTDALGDITTFTYDGTGHLKTVQGAIAAAKSTFAYDNVSRLASATDPAGSTVSYSYDAADRLVKSTYPDGTVSTVAYTLLDATSSTDRLGQVTRYGYDADRERTSTTDPDNNVIRQGYNLAGHLSSITDANGHVTNMTLDAQSRLTAKQYANATAVNVTYSDALSLISLVTDALGQTTTYTYAEDNATATITYGGGHIATPGVSFTYDSSYPRRTSMSDGTGTTSYTYYPANGLGAVQLKTVATPVADTSNTDTLTYTYDALNRSIGMAVNGITRSVGFDGIGRTISATNPLDSFTYGYADGTSRISSVTSTAGPTAALTYFGPSGDELLQQLAYTTHTGSTSLAQYGYTYNADDLVKSMAVSTPSVQTTTYSYDTANRLISALIGTGTPQYQYSYDHASNLTSITPNGPVQSYSYTSTNAITGASYDNNGSPTSLSGVAYTWDGANRIATVAKSGAGTASSFSYDGLGRVVRIVDTHNGAITADHSFLWCGSMRCLAHDNTQTNSPVSTQYFGQGVIVAATAYYYVTDQLGSVTELISNSGTVASQSTYDPYGNRTVVSGTASDIGYAGYFYHAASGLDLTLYRAYDPSHARWVNRDPIAEAGGTNLYAYAGGSPTTFLDPLGLLCLSDFSAGEQAEGEAVAALSTNPTLATIAALAPIASVLLPDIAGAAAAEGTTVYAGHGIESALAGTTIVPDGAALTLPGQAGTMIPDALGQLIESGDWEAIAANPRWASILSGSTTYLPGSTVPNLILQAPINLTTLPGSVTVGGDTTLSTLLNSASGLCVWAACRFVP